MVKVTAPMLSLDASGTLGSAITFAKWKGRNYVRTRVIPSNPQTGLQVGMRAGIAGAPALWASGAPAIRTGWNNGVGTEAISGFNLFCRIGQKALRNNYSYVSAFGGDLFADTPASPGDAAAVQDGTDVDITWTGVAATMTLLIFHSTTTGFTPGIGNLIAVAISGANAFTHRNPGVGTHYYDVRTGALDGGVGALEGEFSAVVA